MTDKNSTTATGKQHFEVLDGLRGVAAICVVYFHFCEFIYPKYPDSPVGHGFLAVDFFFCLSGFVISYAYDERMPKIALKQFFTSRLIRLHPMVIVGAILGILAYLFDPFGGQPFSVSTGKIVLTVILSLFLIPAPILPDRFDNIFSLNAPAWSLFWEYVANVFYALILWRLKKPVLLLLLFFSAIWLVWTSHALWTSGAGPGLSGGWGYNTFWDGASRLSFSFLAGLLIRRLNIRWKNPMGFIGLAVLLMASFAFPYGKYDDFVEAAVVILCFPCLVLLGAGTQVQGTMQHFCNFLGRLSYPLYMTHYAAIWMFGFYFGKHKPAGAELFWVVTISMALMIVIAALILLFVDEPVRAWLTRKAKPGVANPKS